jgi:hypothetical protein
MTVIRFEPHQSRTGTERPTTRWREEAPIYFMTAVIAIVTVLAGYLLWAKI